MNKDTKYLQFPLLLLRKIFTDRDRMISDIFNVGICRYSETLQYSNEDAAKQLIYDYYRNKDSLTNEMIKEVEKQIRSGNLSVDEGIAGFTEEGFDPSCEKLDLITIFDQNHVLAENAMIHLQIHRASYFLGISSTIPHLQRYSSYQKIMQSVPKGEPFPMVNKTLLFKLRDETQTEYDLAQFAAYIGIRSILGKSSYKHTNKDMIIARMFGYIDHKHLHESKQNPIIKPLIEKYLLRYWKDKLLVDMGINWKIYIYGGSGGKNNTNNMVIGDPKKIALKSMIEAAENKKRQRKIDKLKRAQQEALDTVLQQLNKEKSPYKEKRDF
ncbi:MAG: hypothetical protein WCI71_10825 [Bacteroidota bacterium]